MNNQLQFFLIAFFALLLVIGIQPSLFSDEMNKIEGERFDVTLTEISDPSPMGDKKLKFSIFDKAERKELPLVIQGSIGKIHKPYIYDPDYFVLEAGDAVDFWAVYKIFDLKTLSMMDDFLTNRSNISPSGRYIAYETIYPKIIQSEAKKSFLMIYDIPRALEAPIHNNRPGLPFDAAGWPLYPEEFVAGEQPLDCPEAVIKSPVVWDVKEENLYFIARDGEDGYHFLVKVGIKKGVESPDIKKKRFHIRSILKYEGKDFEKMPLNVAEMKLAGNKVSLSFFPEAHWFIDSYEIGLDDF